MLFPFAVAAIFLAVHIFKVSYKYFIKKKRKRRDLNSHAHRLLALFLYLFYFIYLYTVQTALDMFNCGAIVSEDGVEVDDTWYMLSYPEYVCYEKCEEGAEFCQNDYWPYAGFFFMLYGIGYPAFVAYVLLPKNNEYKSFQDQLMKAQGLGGTRDTSYGEVWEWHKRYSRLYYLFKPQYTYWMLFVLFRKLSLASIEILFRENVTFQLAAVLLLFFWAYVMHTRNHPYMSTFEYIDTAKNFKDEIERIDAITRNEQAKLVGIKSSLAAQRGHSGRIDQVIAHGAAKAAKGRDVGGKYLWNWNSVEAVLLMSCVLVAVFGIMFSSAYIEPGDYTYSVLAVCTMVVVIGSLVYFFLVVWSEVVVKVAPHLKDWQCKSWMETNRHHRKVKATKNNDNDENEEDFDVDEIHPNHPIHNEKFEMAHTNPLMAGRGIFIGGSMGDFKEGEDDLDSVMGSMKDEAELQETVKRLVAENRLLKQQAATAKASGPTRPETKKLKKRVGKAKDTRDPRHIANAKKNAAAKSPPSDITIELSELSINPILTKQVITVAPSRKASRRPSAAPRAMVTAAISSHGSDSDDDAL